MIFVEAPGAYHIDDAELIRIRAGGSDSMGFDYIELEDGSPRKIREQFLPGAIVAKDSKFFEVLAAFRLADEPYFWRFVCQEIPDTHSVRNVPEHIEPYYGFDWKDVLPKVMWDFLFVKEEDVYDFYKCLWAPANGRLLIFTTSELLKAQVIVRGDQTRSDTTISIPDPAYKLESPIIQEFNLLS